MPADDNAPTPDAPAVPSAEPAPAGRRRRSRSWSTPGAAPAASFERPLTEHDWNRNTPAAVPVPPPPPAPAASPLPSAPPTPGKVPIPAPPPGKAPIAAPPPGAARIAGSPVGTASAKPASPSSPSASPATAPPPSSTDLADLIARVAELRTDVAGMRKDLTTRDAGLVTGADLAASIEALGTTLGTGLANLLTELRKLLARDLETAADRIVHELGQHLRTSSAQIVDGVEERAQAIVSDGVGELSALLDHRLEQVEEDVSGLRAVVLEIPDQTQVVARLDQLVGGSPEPRVAAAPSPAPRRRAPLRPEPPILADPFADDADEDDDDDAEPVIPVTTPARRAKKAPLRAKPEPKASKPAEPVEVAPARRAKAIKAIKAVDKTAEPAADEKPAKPAPRAPRTARSAGISADAEAGQRAGRRAKR